MKYSKTIRITFLVYAALLLAFLLFTVGTQRSVLAEGNVFKFKCLPVDPTDAFRGKYVQLGFDNNSLKTDLSVIDTDKPIYGKISVDQDGYAFVSEISNQIFDNQPYLLLGNFEIDDSIFHFQYPFDRLYMNEAKAPKAEELYRDLVRQADSDVYAKVFINNGRAILDDVFAGETALKELIR